MASGDQIIELLPRGAMPPGSDYATFDTVADASTPTIIFDVLDFRGATGDEHADWGFEVPTWYAGTTGWTFKYKYAVDGADVDIVDLGFRVLIIADLDILTADLLMDGKTAVSIQDTPAGTANKFNYSATGALAKADMGTPSIGQFVVVRGTRDITAATNTDDLQLKAVLITET